MDLCFAVHKLENSSSNPCKVKFEGLVHLLIYIRDNNNLGLGYYDKIEYETISDLLRQASMNTDKKLMGFSDSQDFPDAGMSIGAYTVMYQDGPIDNLPHVPGPVYQYSAESEYNAA